MNKVIYKYPLDEVDRQTISMPKGAEILSLQVQNGTPCIWALVNKGADMEDRTFVMIGTGHPIMDELYSGAEYIGTAIVFNDTLVWHVFELTN